MCVCVWLACPHGTKLLSGAGPNFFAAHICQTGKGGGERKKIIRGLFFTFCRQGEGGGGRGCLPTRSFSFPSFTHSPPLLFAQRFLSLFLVPPHFKCSFPFRSLAYGKQKSGFCWLLIRKPETLRTYGCFWPTFTAVRQHSYFFSDSMLPGIAFPHTHRERKDTYFFMPGRAAAINCGVVVVVVGDT